LPAGAIVTDDTSVPIQAATAGGWDSPSHLGSHALRGKAAYVRQFARPKGVRIAAAVGER